MTPRLIKLLLGVVLSICAGFFCYPLIDIVGGIFRRHQESLQVQRPARPSAPQEEEKEVEGVVIDEGGDDTGDVPEDIDEVDDGGAGGTEDGDDSDGSGVVATSGESNVDSYMPSDEEAKLTDIVEEEIQVDPAQEKIPAVADATRNSTVARSGKNLIALYDRLEKSNKGTGTRYTNEDLFPDRWKDPDGIYKELTERILQKLGKADEAAIWAFLEDPANRLDLARLTLIRKAGVENIKFIASQKMGSNLLFSLSSDLDWMNGAMYSGPTDNLGLALLYLSRIYLKYTEDMGDATVRRIATTTALEFAREGGKGNGEENLRTYQDSYRGGWGEKDMLARFAYYCTSYQAGKLNVIFDTLRYWDTRIVTGCQETNSWGSVRSLAWQRDNVRLPAEGYLGASGQLTYRLLNVAGDSVFSADYLGPILKYTGNIIAWAHREIGGVCGACSHYGAFGALAAGIPAMTMGEPGHCAYTVRVGDKWEKGYSIYWQHGMAKAFWGFHDWDFLILMQNLYSDYQRTLVSDQLVALGEFFASRKMMKSAFLCFEDAVVTQPLNWPAWVANASYLRQKAPENKAKWKELHDRIVETLAVEYHNAAATLLSRLVYPDFLKLVPDRKERNKLFEAFFKQCKDFGTNRWDITGLLDAQIAGCNTPEDKIAYMKNSLATLMKKPDYAGPVLTWGLDFIAKLPEGDAESDKLQEEFSELIVSAMSRTRSTKKDSDATWLALSEAINTAATNWDHKTFQAIGRMAQRKCKKKFPKNKFKFRRFPGKVISEKGAIQTAVTLSPPQMQNCCLHWGVLQKTGGRIPVKMSGKNGMVVKLEELSELNGVICLFARPFDGHGPLYIEISEDGQNWVRPGGPTSLAGAVFRVDLKGSHPRARFVRLLIEGQGYQPELGGNMDMVGYYVYGKPLKAKK